MAQQNVCRYFKFGYCKFLDMCRLRHISEICRNSSCEIRNCSLRHPKSCKYFRDYRRCKFGEYCYFAHKESENENSVVEIRVKMEDNKKKIDDLEKQISEKDIQITDLVFKLEELKSFTKEYLINKVNNLENIISEKDVLIENLMSKVKCIEDRLDMKEKSSIIEKEGSLKCPHCDFETIHASGLKIHAPC